MSEINKIRNIDKEQLKLMIKELCSKQDVLRALDINIKNRQALIYLMDFIKDNDVDISHHRNGRPLHLRYSYDEASALVAKHICWTDLMKDLGLRFVGNNILTARKLVEHYQLDTSHFDAKAAAARNNSRTKEFYEIFCENSEVHRKTVKDYISKHALIPYKCNECPITDEWNGKPIVLHLEHKNGVGDDNRLENLCYLCPNCHSQTDTYAGRNVLGTKRAKDGSFQK